MSEAQEAGRSERSEGKERTPLLEWIAGGTGAVVTLGVLAFLGWEAWRDPSDSPAAVEVRLIGVAPVAGGYVAEIVAVNLSPATAAAVEIEGELREGGDVIETASATLDYVPARSERRGGLFFQEDPEGREIGLRALGYAEP